MMEYVVTLQIFFIFSMEFAITTAKSRDKKPIQKKKKSREEILKCRSHDKWGMA